MNGNEKLTEILKCLELWAKRAKEEVDAHPYSTGKINFRSVTRDGQMRYKQSFLLEAPSEMQGLAAAHAALFDAFQFSKEIAMESDYAESDYAANDTLSLSSPDDLLNINYPLSNPRNN